MPFMSKTAARRLSGEIQTLKKARESLMFHGLTDAAKGCTELAERLHDQLLAYYREGGI